MYAYSRVISVPDVCKHVLVMNIGAMLTKITLNNSRHEYRCNTDKITLNNSRHEYRYNTDNITLH